VEAAVVLSPHFASRGGILLQGSPNPRQIFDFQGFPPEYYRPFALPGAPEVARRLEAAARAVGLPVAVTDRWGVDHGVWAPFLHLTPEAALPVVPVSLALDGDPALYRELAAVVREAAAHRRWLCVATGSIIHRLDRWDGAEKPLPAEAVAFRQAVLEAWQSGRAAAVSDIAAARWEAAMPEGGRGPFEWLAGAAGDRPGTLLAAESEFGAVSLDVVVFPPA
jgi:4,5-DOPA dioxygenase extradiol